MNKLQANLCLLCVTLCWSTEVILTSISSDILPFAWTCITSLIGAVPIFLLFFKRIKTELFLMRKKLLLRCLFLSALNCAYNTLFLYGISYFDVSSGAFTFSMSVVVLPVVLLVRKETVAKKTWLSVGFVLAGIVLALGSTLRFPQITGVLMMFAGCIIRAVYIVQLNRYAKEHDPVALSGFVSAFVGAISFVIWFAMQPATFAAIHWTREVTASLFIYSYFIVIFAQTLNIFAQRRASATSATVIYALEIVFSLLWGLILPESLVERTELTVFHIVGAVLVVTGSMIEILDFRKGKRHAVQEAEHAE